MKEGDKVDFISGLMKSEDSLLDVRLAKDGDKDAYERLIGSCKLSLYRVAKAILRDYQDIEDAFQETLIKAYRGMPHLKREDYFKSWIIRIMINECNSILRKKKTVGYIEDFGSIPLEADDRYKNMEVQEIINSLEDELRVVTILYYYDDMPQREIARILHIPHGTVRSRLFRARQKLRNMIEDE